MTVNIELLTICKIIAIACPLALLVWSIKYLKTWLICLWHYKKIYGIGLLANLTVWSYEVIAVNGDLKVFEGNSGHGVAGIAITMTTLLVGVLFSIIESSVNSERYQSFSREK